MNKLFNISVLLLAVLFFSCGGSSSKQVTVSWNPNSDAVVNTTGGGYTLYYSQQSGFDITTASVLDVPYVSGTTAPVSAKLMLSQGYWFFRVAAYGILNGTTKFSDSSEQIAVSVGG